ncbi:hypothetical protein H9P43_000663 [Blastocladiella emersonii ATCC 22665]|nr:hypothetical protein H9P43_000663 [Blastocladiella emersonii ATCC 22665]
MTNNTTVPSMLSVPAGATDLGMVLEANRQWSAEVHALDAGFFEELEGGQQPKIMWIGCSDSRVPPNQICKLAPGELFVHRNIANVVPNADLNLLSILQYAVEVLKVEHVVVCGHYGCGGVNAALGDKSYGLIDAWLQNIRSVAHTHRKRLGAIGDAKERSNLMVELNVANSVFNVAHTNIVQAAWKRGQKLAVHGWVYRLQDGRLEDLGIVVDGADKIDPEFQLIN